MSTRLVGEIKVYEREGLWGWEWTSPRGTTSFGPPVFETKAKALAAARKHAKGWGV